jgi:DNA mismatch repair protein MutS
MENRPPPSPAPAPPPAETEKLSPAMRQYQQFKGQYPGYVLFFRMGDFYEMFWEDAQNAARVLGLALTSRSKGDGAVPMAGVPFHAVDGYLRKMIAAGFKVAICEQTETASQAKGVINREVVRLMTPGTLTDEPLLDGRAENFLAAVAVASGRAGVAWAELSTGACWAMSGTEEQVLDEISRLRPAEVLVPESVNGQPHAIDARLRQRGITAITARPGWNFTPHHAKEQVQRQWQAKTTAGFGFADEDPAILATALTSALRAGTRSKITSPSTRPVGEAWRSTGPFARAGPKARCSGRSTARSRRWAAAYCGSGSERPCAMSARSWIARPPSRPCWNRRRICAASAKR